MYHIKDPRVNPSHTLGGAGESLRVGYVWVCARETERERVVSFGSDNDAINCTIHTTPLPFYLL